MKRYETIIITLPDLAPEDRDDVFEKLKALILKEGTTIIKFDEWGLKNLAYEIRKQARGHYACVDYAGGMGLVKELERIMSIDDRIMKYMTVLIDNEFDPASMEEDTKSDSAEEEVKSDSAPDVPDDSEVSEKEESASIDANSEEGA
ncbi:MAG: 30S ribosomal protein S6 [Desulfobacterales bacterium C00003104]|jgi:small subunit ribosomal protein S6|nr:MAG: 30S ribosomal protein S6 [Desulfobacterales bacterium C00003104]